MRLSVAADAVLARGVCVFHWAVVALALAVVLLGTGQGLAGAQAPTAPADGEILVKFKPGIPEREKKETHDKKGGREKERIPKLGVQVVDVSGDEEAEAKNYEDDANVEYAEPNGTYRADVRVDAATNDPQVGQQWQYNNTGQTGGTSGADIRAFGAWDATHGNAQVPIAVLDSGIKESHPDLQNKVTLRQDFTASASGADDVYGHGTHVAGSIAANSNNSVGIAGTCGDWSNCVLYNGKVLNDRGSGSWSGITNGIVWAADNGAKVISMSLGGSTSSQAVEDAVNYAWSKGTVVTAAAGNSGTTTLHYPAAYTNVIAVAATDHNDDRSTFSNYGASWVDVAAPGTSILSTTVDGAYGTKSGTSMATPHVAGVAGLIWSTGICDDGNAATNDNPCLRNQIESKADRINGTGNLWAHGRINANGSVGGTTPPPGDTTAPTVSGVKPADGATRVRRDTGVMATFSEDMRPETLTASTVTLIKQGTTTPVAAAVSYDQTARTVTLKPSARLVSGMRYTATVKGGTGGAADQAGNPLAADKVWSFTTK